MHTKMFFILSLTIFGLHNQDVFADYICNTTAALNGQIVSITSPSISDVCRFTPVGRCQRQPCQSYIQCQCSDQSGLIKVYPPIIECWTCGTVVSSSDGSCSDSVQHGTAVALFDSDGYLIDGTCGAFMGCKDDKALLFDQNCLKSLSVSENCFNNARLCTVINRGVQVTSGGATIPCGDLPTPVGTCQTKTGC